MVLGTGGEVGVLRLFSDPWRFSHRPVGELMKKRKLAGCSGASGKGMYFGDSCGGSPPPSSKRVFRALLGWPPGLEQLVQRIDLIR